VSRGPIGGRHPEDKDMGTNTERKRREDAEEAERERRRRQDEALDEALKETFPASDPVAAEQPVPGS
jgi:hypothetical protein